MKLKFLFLIFSLFCIQLTLMATLVGCSQKSNFDKEKERREEILRRQEEQKKRQENDLKDIQRQEFWNNEMKRYE